MTNRFCEYNAHLYAWWAILKATTRNPLDTTPYPQPLDNDLHAMDSIMQRSDRNQVNGLKGRVMEEWVTNWAVVAVFLQNEAEWDVRYTKCIESITRVKERGHCTNTKLVFLVFGRSLLLYLSLLPVTTHSIGSWSPSVFPFPVCQACTRFPSSNPNSVSSGRDWSPHFAIPS